MRTVPHVTQHRHNARERLCRSITLIFCLWAQRVTGLSRQGPLPQGGGVVAPYLDEPESAEWYKAVPPSPTSGNTGLSRQGPLPQGGGAVAPYLDEPESAKWYKAVPPSVVELSALRDLQIGSFQGGADAVTNGIVQSSWARSSPTLVGPNEAQTRFWAVLSNIASPGVPLAALTVTSAEPNLAVAHVQWPGGAHRHANILVGNVMTPLVTDIVFECRRAGAAGFTVVYTFSDSRIAPVELSLTKECGQRERVGLSLGTSEDHPDNVIRNGVSRWTTGSAMHRIIPPSQDHIDLFWTLRASGGQDDTASQLIAAPRINVKPLSLKISPEGGLPAIEKRRWQHRLASLAAREEEEKHRGLWGVQVVKFGEKRLPEVARVRLTGALQDGGSLPSAAELPTGLPPPSTRLEVECLRMGAALVEIEVSPGPAYQPYRPAVFSFVKQCGGAISNGFDVASYLLVPGFVKPNILKNGVATSSAEGGYAGDVNNLKSTFSVYWRLAERDHGPPDATRVSCDGGIVASKLLPSPQPTYASGGIAAGRQDVGLNCLKSGVAWCTIHFAWQLYEGPSLRFRKFCGGIRHDVDVFSDMAGAPAVFLQGKSNRAWGINPEVTLPADQDKTVFTIAMARALKPGEQALKVASPQLRVFRPDILEATAGGELIDGGQVDKNIEGGSELEVQTKCKQSGDSRVEVTLPISSIEGFKPLNFAFTKHCNVVPYWQQGWLLAALSFSSFFFCAACVMTACMYQLQKQTPDGLYEMDEV